MIAHGWSPLADLEPFDVKNSLKVFLLLAPGAIGAAIDLLLARRDIKLGACSGKKGSE